ncbi:hypothetical protein [Desulforamulus reducens]|nr:hypothetical protein [Desulforamulus reducens]
MELSNIELEFARRLSSSEQATYEGWNNYTDVDGWEEWDHYEEEL